MVIVPSFFMGYNLLFSRSVSGNEVARLTDVPILEGSIMIDVLSLRQRIYRSAGYVAPIVFDGISDYERRTPDILLYGKTRFDFSKSMPSYGLEFTPRYGSGDAIISVYGSTEPPRKESITIPGTTIQVYREVSNGRLMVANSPTSPFSAAPLLPPCVEAIARTDVPGEIWLYIGRGLFGQSSAPGFSLGGGDAASFNYISTQAPIQIPTS